MSAATAAHGSHEWVMAEAERIKALGESASRDARDPVNQPMVNNWVEAMGDCNPVYTDAAAAEGVHGGSGTVAPPAMAQVWTMYGLDPARDPADPLYATMAMLDEAGFTSVIATNCEQTYDRYLRPGDEVRVTNRLESVVGPKRTALGEGYFATTRNTWYVGDERVATMTFRVLKFRPAHVGGGRQLSREAEHAGEAAATVDGSGGRPSEARPDGFGAAVSQAGAAGGDQVVLRPQVNRDTAFFWSGTREGELRVQRCGACGERRHPPGPSCPRCHALEPTYDVVSGRGTVYSYVVHRHPPVPGKQLPVLLVLVELEEGVRMVGELLDATPDDVKIGSPVQVAWVRVDDELTIPAWRLS
jgi:uncharacterized OB-fold protein